MQYTAIPAPAGSRRHRTYRLLIGTGHPGRFRQAYSGDEGLKKYQAGDYAEALNDFDKALSLDANNYQALSNKARHPGHARQQHRHKRRLPGHQLIEKALENSPEIRRFFLQPGLSL